MARAEGDLLKPHWIVAWWLILVVGLALTTVTAATKFGDLDKQDRLRAGGTEVIAAVTGHRDGSGRVAEQIRVAYQAQGRSYQQWIKGDAQVGENMWLWLDPADPAEFVARNGSTDDSLAFFNTWMGMPAGLGFAAIATLSLVRHRRASQAARTAAERGKRRKRRQ
ncbi:hypothetical protein [Catellatospora sp. NPDC049133]|jgi:hypothetical protein|uniref:hypothetical protein n=1 Tax=Catellatospora sp. NPDC049133 TaxID=3155499 RepID=UPI0033E2FCC6